MNLVAPRVALVILLNLLTLATAAENLESQLADREPVQLAKAARILGDPARGALIFHRQGLSCTQCHTAGGGAKLLGPDLSELRDRGTYEHIIESLLEPSKAVRDGYKVEQIVLNNGKLVVGMVRSEQDDQLELFVPGEEQARQIRFDEIDERVPAKSVMPAGLVNQLQTETEFYDLVSFVAEVARGPEFAAGLAPAAELLAPPPLPAYEAELDHAGLISSWNDDSFERGEELYNGLCINCHGSRNRPGSLPNALQFASGKFRNGSDPFSMYKTLTHGYRMMLPQRQLVPREKYDVVHYIREEFLKPYNRGQFTRVDDSYLAGLPAGDRFGPAPVKEEPWSEMDYGPFLINTYELAGEHTQRRPVITREQEVRGERIGRPPYEKWPATTNFAYKGIAVRLDDGPGGVAAGSHWLAFDHDTLRVAGAWSGEGFIDWEGILFNGRHRIAPRTVGDLHFENLPGPGWADPATGSFEDPRLAGRDGRLFGPLPREWAHYRGLYRHGDRVVVSYTVGSAEVLESHRLERNDQNVCWVRILNIGRSQRDLTLRVAPTGAANVLVNGPDALRLRESDGYITLPIRADQTPVNLELVIAGKDARPVASSQAAEDLRALTRGGPAQWPQSLRTLPEVGSDEGAFAADRLTRPVDNPWRSRLRTSGLDFFDDETRMVVCCCDGDVWIVEGIDQLGETISWRRIASGLFQPLGIKIINGRIFVTCRDQIVILNDLNGDGETDYYENFNNDHQVTDHFHEFAMGLQVDDQGNLYYAKSARHAKDWLVPQHGTLLRVSADGRYTSIVANGFRAANGVCLNDDGSFFVTDQEGHWVPMNRINRVVEGGFYGNIYSYGSPDDRSDSAMLQPVCWPNKEFDRSPSELIWVDSEQWGPLQGSLLNISYGYGKIYTVPHEEVDGQWQGGMCRLPLPDFPTGTMRARFHPGNGQMYTCGMFAWASSQSESPGGLWRIRYTGKPAHLPIGLNAKQKGMKITFTEALDRNSALDPENYLVETWSLRRTASYGSRRHDEETLEVRSVSLSEDGRSVTLEIPNIAPTWCMQIGYRLKDSAGKGFSGVIQNTVHVLGD